MHLRHWLILGGAVLSAALSTSSLAADLARGKQLFTACAACHSERSDALGPSLKGVVGRKSGSLPNFRYSATMKRADIVWDEKNLREYVTNPQAKVKGNRMPFSGFANTKDADDVVAYLATLK